MKITETHKNFEGGMKGRLTIYNDAGEVLDTIYTPAQKARAYCEKNQQTDAGIRFAVAVAKAESQTNVPAGPSLVSADVDRALVGAVALPVPMTEAVAKVMSSVPAPPELTGKNPTNTALISARVKLSKLYAAALGCDPLPALAQIKTSRGNKYLNTCDDYRTLLLAHFSK